MSKIALVTGSNTGIGKATAEELAKAGLRVIMVCRNKEQGEQARKEIIKNTGNDKVRLYIADLSSISSIKNVVEEIKKDYQYLDILINNAGVVMQKRTLTEDGLEYQFAVNYLSQFLLINLLFNLLSKSSSARIINVSSQTYISANIDFDDLQSAKRYHPTGVYSNTKMMVIWLTYYLAERLKNSNITINCLHPGVIATNLLKDYRGIPRTSGAASNKNIKEGSETSIYLALSDEIKDITGKYFVDKRESRTSAESYDLNKAKKLWEISLKLTGIEDNIPS